MPEPLGRLLGSGNVAEVFAYGSHALKLYRTGTSKASPFREAANLAVIESLGISAPRVLELIEHGGRWGVVMTLAEGEPLGKRMLTQTERIDFIGGLVALQRRLHALPAPGLPALKHRLASRIAAAAELGPTTKTHLLTTLSALPDGDRLCHGDFHPWNIHGDPETATIVDWLDATAGPPEADACRSYLLFHQYDPGVARLYLTAFSAAAGTPEANILDWLPIMAAARLVELPPEQRPQLLALMGDNAAQAAQ